MVTRVSGTGRGVWCRAAVGWVKRHGGRLPLLPDAGTSRCLLFCPSPPLSFPPWPQFPGNFPFPLKGTTSSSGASPLARCGSCALPWVDVGRGWGCPANQLLPGRLTGACWLWARKMLGAWLPHLMPVMLACVSSERDGHWPLMPVGWHLGHQRPDVTVCCLLCQHPLPSLLGSGS